MNRHSTVKSLLLGLCIAFGGLRAAARITTSIPPQGSTAPALKITDLDGKMFDPARVAEHPYVLVFGELYHQPTRQGCAEIEQVLSDPRLAGETITPILIVTQKASRLELKTQAESLGLAALVLHDPDRKVFEDYHISVMPTVVVVGPDHKIVYSVAGMMPRLGDLVTDALLYSLGRLSKEQFDASLHPDNEETLSEDQIRAGRLTQLARQLARRGLDEMAEEKFGEALRLWPQSIEARLGLGRLDLRRNRIADAEAQFRAVLKIHPEVIEATLGVAYVETVRGGADELADAEHLVKGVLDKDDNQPRAHYLMGLIYEQRDKVAEAAASFKRSAELLLERQVTEP